MSDSSEQPPASDDVRRQGADAPASALWQEEGTQPLSVSAFVAVLLRHRRALAILPFLVAFVWVVVLLILPREYTSPAMFTPSSSAGQLSQLEGLAAQFGVNVPQGQTNESPDFYASLIQSEELLRSAVVTTYRFPASSESGADTISGDLVTLLRVRRGTRSEKVEKAIQKLQDQLSVNSDASTGLVTLSVTTRWAALSRQVGERLLALVNSFNLQTRQTQAAAERRFLEGRVRTVRDSLQNAENTLQAFLEHNRSYQSSPELQFEYDRLESHVTLEQQVYTTLAQSLEQARMDEVRNTPVITVVEPPQFPARPDRRYLPLKAVLGFVLGGVAAVVWAFGSEWVGKVRQREPDDYRQMEELWEDTKRDLRALWRRVRRWGPR